MTLGALCRQMGETEHAYIQSLKTLKQEWSYHHPEADVTSHVARLTAWFQTLDEEMQAILTTFWDEEGNKTIDRGGGTVTVEFQLDVYLQAVLIFLGKATKTSTVSSDANGNPGIFSPFFLPDGTAVARAHSPSGSQNMWKAIMTSPSPGCPAAFQARR